MRRIKLVLAAVALVMATFAAISGPAMADDLNCRDARGDLIRCDGDLFAPVDDDFGFFPQFDEFGFPFFTSFFFVDDNCPFLGDTSGIVNEFDCFN